MSVLEESIANNEPVKICSAESTSVAALVPVKRPHGSVCFGLDDNRFLRIDRSGRTDLNGGRNGPWTEFSATSNEVGAILLKAVKSGKWLTILGGEFVSSDQPEPLLLELDAKASTLPENSSVEFTLRSMQSNEALPWPVQLCRKGGYVFLRTMWGNVACNEQGKFHNKGGQGKWAQWQMEESSGGISLKNVGHGGYLTLAPQGILELADAPAFFNLENTSSTPSMTEEMPLIDRAVLSASDIALFKEQGYIVVRHAVLPEFIRDALRSINFQLGKPDCWEVDSNPLNAAQLALKLPPTGVGRDIFNKSSVFWSAVNILLGAGNVAPWHRGQHRGLQVALRFPQPPERGHDVPDTKPGTQYHIDGMGQNRLCPFTLLCGVALSDQMLPNMGNLHVFPGSHLHAGLQNYYREKINDDEQGEADSSKPDLGESVQVLLRPGDVVIAHQLLAHRVGVNTSEHIRYQLYYRVKHKDHDELKGRIIDDPWVEFAI